MSHPFETPEGRKAFEAIGLVEVPGIDGLFRVVPDEPDGDVRPWLAVCVASGEGAEIPPHVAYCLIEHAMREWLHGKCIEIVNASPQLCYVRRWPGASELLCGDFWVDEIQGECSYFETYPAALVAAVNAIAGESK